MTERNFVLLQFVFQLPDDTEMLDKIGRCVACQEQLVEGDVVGLQIEHINRVVGETISFGLQLVHQNCSEIPQVKGTAE